MYYDASFNMTLVNQACTARSMTVKPNSLSNKPSSFSVKLSSSDLLLGKKYLSQIVKVFECK